MKYVGSILLLFLLLSAPSIAQTINLRGTWKFHIDDNHTWASPQFDDSGWKNVFAPSAWEDEGFNGYDGFAWYRRKFDGKQLSKKENYYLRLGYIDDCDEVYVNGKLIGFSGRMPPRFKTSYNTERRYLLPPEVINFSGENTIAIRVFDVMQGGGIVDGELGIFQQEKNKLMVVDLQGVWSFAPSENKDPIRNKNDWKKIMVPGPWEHQDFQDYDGFAWYKKTFILPPEVSKAGLVLVLGKIDDFDVAYLNGKVIGSTNDHRPYGRSESYEQTRIYDIPAASLKAGENVIEVLVEDMGNIGGIYEGPVGITTHANAKKILED